jgi:hypothetical protein
MGLGIGGGDNRDASPGRAGACGRGGHLSYQEFEYIADVKPDSGAPRFRATVQEPRNGIHFRAPEVGQVVRVKFHPKNEHVKFDRSDPGIHRDLGHGKQDKEDVAAAHTVEAQRRFEAIADAMPGTAPAAEPDGASSLASSAPAESALGNESVLADISAAVTEMAATVAGLSASTADVTDTIDAIRRARAAGDLAEVQRLKAEFAQGAAEDRGPLGEGVARLGSSSVRLCGSVPWWALGLW